MPQAEAEAAAQRALGAQAAGYMMLVGAALAAISVALPPIAMGAEYAVVALGALSALVGAVLLSMKNPPPEWVLGVTAALGTLMITVATYEGGRIGAGTVDNVMLYIWICLLAFNFLSLWHALGQLLLVGLCYGFLLSGEPTGEAAIRWVVSFGSLLVAGVIVHRLQTSRAKLFADLSERARRDGLTGLLNRSALEERVVLELTRAKKNLTPLSLIVIDIDQFKGLNDSQGHPVGDEVLKSIAACLNKETREIDAVARLGGDEFGALLPGAGEIDALRVADRLVECQRVSDRKDAITFSVGVAQAAIPEDTFEGLWNRADKAMYEAKRAGGGTVRSALRSSLASGATPELVA